MCGHTRDPIIYSEFHRNPFRGFGAPGGQNLAFPITLASRFYNSLYYRTSRDVCGQSLCRCCWLCCYGLHCMLPVFSSWARRSPDVCRNVSIIIITTRAVVIPKTQSTRLSTEADFSCSKYTKRREVSEGCPGWESVRIADREGPACFLKLL